MHARVQKPGVVRNVALGTHVLLAIIVELKYVLVQRDFLVLFSNHMPGQALVLNLLFRHGTPVLEAPVARTHVVVLVVGVGPVFQRVFQQGAHFRVGIQVVVFFFGQHHRLPLDVGLAVGGVGVIIPRLFGEKQDGLALLQLVFKRVGIFQRQRCVRFSFFSFIVGFFLLFPFLFLFLFLFLIGPLCLGWCLGMCLGSTARLRTGNR